jgi:hypothetical protein
MLKVYWENCYRNVAQKMANAKLLRAGEMRFVNLQLRTVNATPSVLTFCNFLLCDAFLDGCARLLLLKFVAICLVTRLATGWTVRG